MLHFNSTWVPTPPLELTHLARSSNHILILVPCRRSNVLDRSSIRKRSIRR
ncbi:uncharacterized protein LACBIDRAFT_296805 [Laccaria bicolor S238N-H82]|uniref:Predicted protein n=1 Tax=Laccaria bicolor (strain S238N-H82 / ATCC MYA-4686) TaxID=486041 RepID=B0DRZ6_LACBS|nr:uncharacterized protein LACBIDRAFT_308275 [Laccaria bicolor S238N-H82]XP_001890612.1 uncharacterized protein LACBIDRAFT_296805 [Laccaria bicolor S238N-H82]EDQ98735.1 predicted protein [Laccaria bicolor S238N-H82]EDR02613.1 predicted protein [Laccaria bicolor S238N-H82]|eukprot:XP_001886657.1 predicted protein [Laccaria bicolor S238N-H82]